MCDYSDNMVQSQDKFLETKLDVDFKFDDEELRSDQGQYISFTQKSRP